MGFSSDTKESKCASCASWFLTCRAVLALFVFFGFWNMYALRVNMSVAMVCMINQTAVQQIRVEFDANYNNTLPKGDSRCSLSYDNDTSTADKEDGDFTWNKQTQGLILGAFFWGYIVTQIPGGWLAVKFGGKRIFGWCMFVCALCTLMTPFAARTSAIFLMVLRVVAGLGQGVVFPAMHAIWAYWAPPLERSKLIGFSVAGTQLGVVITFPIAGLLCEYGFDNGWPSIFYIFGSIGMVWFLLWMIFAHDTPEQHPRISDKEKEFIQNSLSGQTCKNINVHIKVPWLSIFKSGPVWAIIVAHFCGNWTTYTFLTNTPTYLKEVLQFDIKKNGFISAIPYVGTWAVTIISSIIADKMRSEAVLSTTNVRKLNCALGMLIPALALVGLGYLNCKQWILAVILVIISVSTMGFALGAGYVVNHADIAPKYSGLLFGLSNTAATIPGFMAPYVIGALTTNQTQGEWRIVFFISAAITSFGFLFYLFMGSGDLQIWAQEDEGKTIPDNTQGPRYSINSNCIQEMDVKNLETENTVL